MRPASGRASPAIRLSTVLLPAPERPKSAVTAPPVMNAASSEKLPTRQRTSNSSIAARGAHRGAAQEHLRGHQRGEGQQDREYAEPQRLRVAAGHLGEGVDRERQRLRFPWDVGDEGDGGAELAQDA